MNLNALPVTSLGSHAFSGSTNLTGVSIPDSVTSLGTSAFAGCTSLTNVTIPNAVTNVGSGVFSACTRLSAIAVDALNSFYCSVDGVLFNQNQTTLIQYCYLAGTTGWGMLYGGRSAMRVPYNYTTNNSTLTLTRYTGNDSVVNLPSTINAVPLHDNLGENHRDNSGEVDRGYRDNPGANRAESCMKPSAVPFRSVLGGAWLEDLEAEPRRVADRALGSPESRSEPGRPVPGAGVRDGGARG